MFFKRILSSVKKYRRQLIIVVGFLVAVFLIYFAFCLPRRLFDLPRSTVVEASNGKLLSAVTAADGQWRFPPGDTVPPKFTAALTAFEDRKFYSHHGVKISSVFRAAYQNLKAGRTVSGGSTLTMQIARMARNQNRNYFEKLIEAVWAMRLELRYNKNELLKIYASNAPFGGNVVGLEAASWRYFGASPQNLSWAQSACLAVLPNAPGLIHPGKNRNELRAKRNKLLKYLAETGTIDALTLETALDEPIPKKPRPLPDAAPHLLAHLKKTGSEGKRIKSTLNYEKQQLFTTLMQAHTQRLAANQIHNSALIVIDLNTNETVTYVGNGSTSAQHSKYVDIVQSPRSPGSILKPLLYARMMEEGKLHPRMLIPDIPLKFSNFTPKNFVDEYDGMVTAQNALTRSLNIPAVYLLQEYGIEKFLSKMRSAGFSHLNRSADEYGLSLILGGSETTLWDVVKAYAGMAKTLKGYNETGGYSSSFWSEPKLFHKHRDAQTIKDTQNRPIHFDAASIYLTLKMLTGLERPGSDQRWRWFSSSRKISWKTGTSFGNRDAWAVGCTPDYLVGVWVGNATGEGRPAIVGAKTAGPVLLDVFSRLPASQSNFSPPYDEMEEVTFCSKSGLRNLPHCPRVDTLLTHKNAAKVPACKYHKTVTTDIDENFSYYRDCAPDIDLVTKAWFVLPPLHEWFYKQKNPQYKPLPPLADDCKSTSKTAVMDFVYPKPGANAATAVDLSGRRGKIVFELAHRKPQTRVFWHLNNTYLGETTEIHKMAATVEKGKHTLLAVDENGEQKFVVFRVD